MSSGTSTNSNVRRARNIDGAVGARPLAERAPELIATGAAAPAMRKRHRRAHPSERRVAAAARSFPSVGRASRYRPPITLPCSRGGPTTVPRLLWRVRRTRRG
jgi:hypothetical protein